MGLVLKEKFGSKGANIFLLVPSTMDAKMKIIDLC